MSREPTTPPTAPSVQSSLPDATIAGKLDADRVCARCAHQLSGQTVYRDRRLALLFLRCPECGTVAAVTEFPIAGRWMRRFGAFLIAVMLLFNFALLVADVAGSTACIYMSSWESARVYVPMLQEAAKVRPLASSSTPQSLDYFAPTDLAHDRAAIATIAASPGLATAARDRFWFNVVPAVLVAVVSGIVWSMMLVHRPLRTAWLWLIAPTVLSCGIAFFIYWVTGVQAAQWTMTYGVPYNDLAFRAFGLPMLVTAMGIMFVVRFAAFLIGRPLIRLMVALVVPVKLRRAAAEEWCDPAPRIVE